VTGEFGEAMLKALNREETKSLFDVHSFPKTKDSPYDFYFLELTGTEYRSNIRTRDFYLDVLSDLKDANLKGTIMGATHENANVYTARKYGKNAFLCEFSRLLTTPQAKTICKSLVKYYIHYYHIEEEEKKEEGFFM